MASKHPLFCCSHRVRGTATIRLTWQIPPGAATGADITIAEGLYWTDPVTSNVYASDTNDLLGIVTNKINTLMSDPDAMHFSYNTSGIAYTGFYAALWGQEVVSGQFHFNGGHANNTAAGRSILARIGANQISDDPSAISTDPTLTDLILGIWSPDRGEADDVDEGAEGQGSTSRSIDGHAYPFSFGSQLPTRMVSFSGLPAALARMRSVSSGYDYSFERCIKPYLMAGEKVRYYADRAAIRAYLTAAMTATSTTASVSSGTGLANNEWIWINGELCKITSGGGTATLTLFRPNPVAHSKYDPVSDDFVATYVLDNNGGDISMESWSPKRRSAASDRWALDIPLLRAA